MGYADYYLYLLSTYPKGEYIQLRQVSSMYKHADPKTFVKLSDEYWEKLNSDVSLKEKYKNGYSLG